MREEFGFKRTICSCRKCSLWCEHLPGYLVPSDLDRLIPSGEDPFSWAEQHLLASPGLQIRTPQFSVSIPSLVPRRQANGHCHWLEGGRCSVHENSPFGCAFLSQCGQTNTEAERITNAGREDRAKAFAEGAIYSRIWQHLWDKGLRELASAQGRRQAALAISRIERADQRRKLRREKKAKRRRSK